MAVATPAPRTPCAREYSIIGIPWYPILLYHCGCAPQGQRSSLRVHSVSLPHVDLLCHATAASHAGYPPHLLYQVDGVGSASAWGAYADPELSGGSPPRSALRARAVSYGVQVLTDAVAPRRCPLPHMLRRCHSDSVALRFLTGASLGKRGTLPIRTCCLLTLCLLSRIRYMLLVLYPTHVGDSGSLRH